MPFLEHAPRLYYETHGNGPALILIHGLGSSSADWELQIPAFSLQFNTITLDLRGFGQSDKSKAPYTIAVMADDVIRLMDQLQLQKAHLLGISMGGWIGLQLAVTVPERIASLTAVNCGPDVKPRNFRQRMEILRRLILFQLLSMNQIGTLLSKRLFPNPEQQDIRAIFIERWSNNDKGTYMAAFRGALGWSVLDQLSNIHCPTHIISSQFDYTDLSLKQQMVQAIPNAHLSIIEDARHAVPVERPEAFNQAVLDFLEKTERR